MLYTTAYVLLGYIITYEQLFIYSFLKNFYSLRVTQKIYQQTYLFLNKNHYLLYNSIRTFTRLSRYLHNILRK